MTSLQTVKNRIRRLAAASALLVVVTGCRRQDANSTPSEPTDQCPEESQTISPNGSATEAAFREVTIEDLDGIESPNNGGEVPTTAMLERRAGDHTEAVADGITIETRCGANYCADGLTINDAVSIRPAPTPEQSEVLEHDGSTLERVIRPIWIGDDFVSIYLATSEYSGGNRTHNTLKCRTYERATGRPVDLEDIVGKGGARQLLAKAAELMDPGTALEQLGEQPPRSGFEFHPRGFRVSRNRDAGSTKNLRLCGEGPVPGVSGTSLELNVDAIPAVYLLR